MQNLNEAYKLLGLPKKATKKEILMAFLAYHKRQNIAAKSPNGVNQAEYAYEVSKAIFAANKKNEDAFVLHLNKCKYDQTEAAKSPLLGLHLGFENIARYAGIAHSILAKSEYAQEIAQLIDKNNELANVKITPKNLRGWRSRDKTARFHYVVKAMKMANLKPHRDLIKKAGL